LAQNASCTIDGVTNRNVKIDIEVLIAAYHTLAERVENIFVEGVGGWMVPIQEDYFVKDLAIV
jgi:dethiobiotin synthetase